MFPDRCFLAVDAKRVVYVFGSPTVENGVNAELLRECVGGRARCSKWLREFNEGIGESCKAEGCMVSGAAGGRVAGDGQEQVKALPDRREPAAKFNELYYLHVSPNCGNVKCTPRGPNAQAAVFSAFRARSIIAHSCLASAPRAVECITSTRASEGCLRRPAVHLVSKARASNSYIPTTTSLPLSASWPSEPLTRTLRVTDIRYEIAGHALACAGSPSKLRERAMPL